MKELRGVSIFVLFLIALVSMFSGTALAIKLWPMWGSDPAQIGAALIVGLPFIALGVLSLGFATLAIK